MSSEVIIRGGTILTIDPELSITTGDVAIKDGVIAQVGGTYTPATGDYDILDGEHAVVMPGLVQSHVHTCQTLARGRGDDLELLDWLKQVVWPYEASLDAEAARASAELACVELLRGGTTAILDMGTVHHTDAIFQAAQISGIRATIGKAMMDEQSADIPPGLRETTRDSLAESERLIADWHGRAGGRLRYAYAPRFALSCTDDLLRQVARDARAAGVRIHTHASENRAELAEVVRLRKKTNIAYLHDVGMTGRDVGLAHCVHVTPEERDILADTGTHLLHCPSSNLKLASGIAEIPELLDAGVAVSLGADGAPCNNNLDAFVEVRLAALLHKPRVGPRAMPAHQVLRMATLGGAAALGLDEVIGSLEIGKRGDVIVVDVSGAHIAPAKNPYSQIVYAAHATDVRHTIVDGQVIVRDKNLLTLDPRRVADNARKIATRIFPLGH